MIPHNELMKNDESVKKVLRQAFIGPEAYGMLVIRDVPGLADAHSATSLAAIKSLRSETVPPASYRTRSGWPGLRHPLERDDPLQGGFLHNMLEDVGPSPRVDPIFGKNVWPTDDPAFKAKFVALDSIIFRTVMNALGPLDEVVQDISFSKGFPDPPSLKEMINSSSFIFANFKDYFHDYSRADTIFDEEKRHGLKSGTDSINTSSGGSEAINESSSMCFASTPSWGIDATSDLSSMHIASTSSRSGRSSVEGSDINAELSSMRTASTSSRSSSFGSCSADGASNADTELSSMRTASTSSRSAADDSWSAGKVGNVDAGLPHSSASELSSMRTASTSSRGSAAADLGTGSAQSAAGQDVQNDDFWLPWHIDPNTLSAFTSDIYYDSNGNILENITAQENQPLGLVAVNSLGEFLPVRAFMDNSCMVLLMAAGGQVLTGGLLRAGFHGVMRKGVASGLGRSIYFNAFYGAGTRALVPPSWDAALSSNMSISNATIMKIADPIVKSVTNRTNNRVLYDFRRQFQRLPVGFETTRKQSQFEALSHAVPLPILKQPFDQPIVIDIFTDLSCPIAHLAIKRLKKALVSSGTESKVLLRLHMLLLNPDMADKGEDIGSYMLRKRNLSLDEYSSPETPLNRAAKELGYNYKADRRVIKPLMAHSAVQVVGLDLAVYVYDALAKRYNEHGEDINNVGVISEVFAEVGVDVSDKTYLAQRLDLGKEQLVEMQSKWDSLLATVPHFLLRSHATGSGFELDGALKLEAFESALKSIASVPSTLGVNSAVHSDLGINLPRGMLVPAFGGRPTIVPQVDRLASITILSVNLEATGWKGPPTWPYDAGDFARQDENDDSVRYDQPNFVKHIDDAALQSLTGAYLALFSSSPSWLESTASSRLALLDTSSSWVSHYPPHLPDGARVVVQGMNEQELAANQHATERLVLDLNKDPNLPYESHSFDFVTNVASFAYLTRPRQVISEWHRVLKPGGIAIISFSNRYFERKATAIWQRLMDEEVLLADFVKTCFYFAPHGGWDHISSIDISPHHSAGDPMWVVMAIKGTA